MGKITLRNGSTQIWEPVLHDGTGFSQLTSNRSERGRWVGRIIQDGLEGGLDGRFIAGPSNWGNNP
jgi:hypothetical protein